MPELHAISAAIAPSARSTSIWSCNVPYSGNLAGYVARKIHAGASATSFSQLYDTELSVGWPSRLGRWRDAPAFDLFDFTQTFC